jgi:hypothetical protein
MTLEGLAATLLTSRVEDELSPAAITLWAGGPNLRFEYHGAQRRRASRCHDQKKPVITQHAEETRSE